MNQRTLSLLCAIVLCSGILGFLTLTRGHDWGDDFAAYIMQAQSIVDGRMNEFVEGSTFAVEASSAKYGPATTPWGFPLMLAPVYALFGLTVLGFKLVVTTSYMAFLVAFFCLARTRLDEVDALILTAVMAFNVGMLQAQNNILSDLPFLWWSTLGLWLAERFGHLDVDSPGMVMWGAVLGLVVFAAAFTRPNGFLLFVPVAATQVLTLRATSSATRRAARTLAYIAMPYLVCGVCYFAQGLIFPSSGVGMREQFASFSPESFWGNLGYYFWLPGTFFEGIIKWGTIAYAELLLFAVLGFSRRPGRNLPALLFVVATFALYVVFPLPQGLRYLYPILPVLLIFAFVGTKAAAESVIPRFRTGALAFLYLAWIGLAGASLIMGTAQARTNLALGRIVPGGWQAGPFSAASQEMFAFIRQNTPADAVVIFFKPRAMRLFTQRVSFVSSACTDLAKGDYVVLVNDDYRHDQIAPNEILDCNAPPEILPIYRQQGFLGYKILRSP